MTKTPELWGLGISRQALAGARNPEWLNVSITEIGCEKKRIRKIGREILLIACSSQVFYLDLVR